MWITGKHDMSEDNKWNAQRIVNDRRRKAVESALDTIKTMMAIENLNKWWLSDTKYRAEHGIVPGTAEYAQIVAACAAKKAELAASPFEGLADQGGRDCEIEIAHALP
jgi:hypothetical protein